MRRDWKRKLRLDQLPAKVLLDLVSHPAFDIRTLLILYDTSKELRSVVGYRLLHYRNLTLDLVDEDDDRYTCKLIMEIFKKCPSLDEISLRLSSDTHWQFLLSPKLFRAVAYYCNINLRSFELLLTQLTSGQLRSGVLNLTQYCPYLRRFVLENSVVDDSIIHALGQQWTYLEHLGLVNCPNVSNAGLIKGISRLPLIRSLDVSYCKGITVEGIQRIINMYQDRWDIAEIVREELQTGYDRNGDPANPTEREKLLLQLIKPFQLKLMFSGVEVDKLDYRKDLVKVETSRSRQVYTSIYGGNVEEILTGRVFNPISLQLRTSWTNRPPTSMSTSDTSGSHVDLSLPPKRKADEKASGLSVKKARVECVLAKSTTDISS